LPATIQKFVIPESAPALIRDPAEKTVKSGALRAELLGPGFSLREPRDDDLFEIEVGSAP